MSASGPTANPSVFINPRVNAKSLRSGLSKSIESLSTLLYTCQAQRRREERVADLVTNVLQAYELPRGCGMVRNKSHKGAGLSFSRPSTAAASRSRPTTATRSRPNTAPNASNTYLTSAPPLGATSPITSARDIGLMRSRSAAQMRSQDDQYENPPPQAERPSTAPTPHNQHQQHHQTNPRRARPKTVGLSSSRPSTAPSARLMKPLDRSPRKRPVSAAPTGAAASNAASLTAAATASLLHPFNLRQAYLASLPPPDSPHGSYGSYGSLIDADADADPQLEHYRPVYSARYEVLVAEREPGEDVAKLTRREIGRKLGRFYSTFLHHNPSQALSR